ncbi:aftiphilin isoform X2 [Danio aesculapii]|uniref:aftiphilin isoform X2 n=1 Tax=Danio aesculapii TaxID=1142201 RepID=UPI0024C0E4A4|nr:aftiphilin isoform X2 [Danio aesculapii]
MEPDVVRLYSSSPPPLDEAGEEEEEDEFGEFGGFDGGGVSSSFSLSELDTPTTYDQSNALEDSPPDLIIKCTQNIIVSENNGWTNEKERETESISSFEIAETESSGILTNGMTSSDLQVELSDRSDQNSLSMGPDVQNSSTGYEHSLSNGYSESCSNSDLDQSLHNCLQSTHTEVNSGPDASIADVLDRSRITDKLPDSNNHSSHTEACELRETEAGLEICGDSQCLSSCSDAQEVEGEQEQSENFVVCFDAVYLDESMDHVDKAEAETVSSVDADLISDTQPSGDAREIHGSSANSEVGIDADVETLADPTADEDFCDFRDATQGFADFSRTESITQEGLPEFVTAMSRCSTDDDLGDTDTLKDFKEEDELAEEIAGEEGGFCSELPPSDSFADFSSAPFEGAAGGEDDSWAAFAPHEGPKGDQDSWATFGEEQSSYAGKKEQEVETSSAPSSEDIKSNTVDFSCKVQHLFTTAFPLDVHAEVSEVTEVLPLHKFLPAQDPQEQSDPSSSFFAQENALVMWRHLQDILGSHGLKFKWAGSHSNRILLNCLGIRNILFTGDKNQPLIVPMFAAGLGMLEPTKESQKSPASPALCPYAPLESGNILCTQVANSLAISIDGVDPEIYELTTAKMENNATGRNIADAFTKLMESIEKTKPAVRKPETDEDMSEEAAKVISLLPDLSFMKARVLMFPSILTPAANHI